MNKGLISRIRFLYRWQFRRIVVYNETKDHFNGLWKDIVNLVVEVVFGTLSIVSRLVGLIWAVVTFPFQPIYYAIFRIDNVEHMRKNCPFE